MCDFCSEENIENPKLSPKEKLYGCIYRIVKTSETRHTYAIEFATTGDNPPCFARVHYCPECGRKL